MTVAQLQEVYFDNIVLYKRTGDSWEDQYKGSASQIPSHLLSCEIRNMGAKKKDWLDVCIK